MKWSTTFIVLSSIWAAPHATLSLAVVISCVYFAFAVFAWIDEQRKLKDET